MPDKGDDMNTSIGPRHRRADDEADSGLAKIMQINRTVSFWPVVGGTISICMAVVYQATVMQQGLEQQKASNLALQAKINEMSSEIKALSTSGTMLAADSNLMKYQLNAITGRVDGIENRVNSIERMMPMRK